MTLIPGTTVGRYQILEPLGQGGMATVYKAFQPSLEREVALKVLRPGFAQDPEFRERFEREAKSIARLRHPNIVQVFDFEVSSGGEFVLAMEFLDGGTLKDRMVELASAGRVLDPMDTVRILWEVADALSYAHEAGIVHRDVKPSNVMLAKPRDRAVVTDFGIARILGATSHTQTGVGIGTPEYMAPEQGQGGKVDHRADIYSLGAMAYELLVGRVPYTADTPLAVVIAHIKDPLPLPSKVNPTIGRGVEKALLRALAKDPAQRYDSATAFAEALKTGLAEDTRGGTMPTIVVRGAVPAATTTRPASASSKPLTISMPSALTRRPVAIGVAGALVVALIAGTAAVSGALRGSAAPTATPAPTATTRDPIPKGALYWEAKLDGTQSFIRPGSIRKNFGQSATNKDPDAVVLRTPAGAVEIANVQANSQLEFAFDSPIRQNYVAEIDLQFPEGGKILAQWTFRRVGSGGSSGSYWLQLEPDNGRVFFQYNGGGSAAGTQRIADPAIVPGLQERQKVTIALVVEDTRFTVFADGRQMLQVTDARVPASAQPLPVAAYSTTAGATGTMRITRARFFELDRAAVAPLVSAAAPSGGGSPSSPAPTQATASAPSATANPAATPKFAIPAKGALIADMPLTASLFRGTNQGLSQNRIDVRFTAGAAEFTATQANSAINGDINRVLPDPDRHIVELDLAAKPASDLSISYVVRQWAFQSEQQKAYGSFALVVSADTFNGGVQLHSAPQDRIDTVGGTVAGVADMQKGFTVAIVVQHPTYTIFLDQKQIAKFTVTGELGSPRPSLGVQGQSGSIKLLGLRFYELPR